MHLKESLSFLPLLVALYATSILAIDFSDSHWIWTNERDASGNFPAGTRAFRNDFCPPQGKTPEFANIIITTDNAYTLFVNGNQVGSGDNWPLVGAYCVQLIPAGCNTFALTATNYDGPGDNPAGVLAAIEISYTDGSISTLVTDGSWRYFESVPNGFQEGGFDDSSWPAASIVGDYGDSPWDFLALPPSPSASFLHFSDANWIWTNEVEDAEDSAPVGSRAFRKDIVLPQGITATSAFFTISVDDEYELFVQGNLVGSGSAWQEAQIYNVELNSTSQITIVVNATNTGFQAGLIGTVQLTLASNGCGAYASVITDDTWRTSTFFSDGFQMPGFDDSAWGYAFVETGYGGGVWGNVPVGAPGLPGISSR